MAWTESGLFYATWRDTLKQAIAANLVATGNNIALSSISDTPDYTSNAGASLSTWTNANEVTGGANWPTGGINLSTGTYAPALSITSKTLAWTMNSISIASTTTTAAAYGAYIYANALSPKAEIIGIWFGGSGYSTVAGTFAITWNASGIMTMQMAA